MSVVVDIADSVVTTLNAGSFSEAFTAERSYLPRYELKEMQSLRVTVVPKGMTTEPMSRGTVTYDVQIDVAIQKRLGDPTNAQAESDGLMALAEQVATYLRSAPLVDQPSARWTQTEHPAIYAPEHLEQLRQFTAVMTLNYRVAS